MNLFAVIKIDLPQFLQIFLANEHHIVVCKDKVLIHSFDVVHIHKEALVAPQKTRSRQFLLNLAEFYILCMSFRPPDAECTVSYGFPHT